MSDYRFTGQREAADVGLYFFNARWYAPGIMTFASPDSLIPDPANPLDWNRYSYGLNNPSRMIDPSGHSACDVVGADPECNDPGVPFTATIKERLAENQKASAPASPSSPTTGNACPGSNWSVICLDPTLIKSGSAQTNTVYPVYQTPEGFDGPFSEESCAAPLCWILVLADGANFLHYQTNLPARLTKQYVVAKVNYEVHKDVTGYYTKINSLDITNQKNSPISLSSLIINDIGFKPNTINIDPGMMKVTMPTFSVMGPSATITLKFMSQSFNIIVLIAKYP